MALLDDLLNRFDALSTLPRRVILTTVLNEQNIPFTVESCGGNCTNIVVSMTKETTYDLLVAHYDIDSYQLNADAEVLGVAILIWLIKFFQEEDNHRPFKVLFSDRKNTGLMGSQHFAHKHRQAIKRVVVLDMLKKQGQGRLYSSLYEAFNDLPKIIKYEKRPSKSQSRAFDNEGLSTLVLYGGMSKQRPEINKTIGLRRILKTFLIKKEQPQKERPQPIRFRTSRVQPSDRK